MAVSTVTERVKNLPHGNPFRAAPAEYQLDKGNSTYSNAAADTTVGRITEVDFTVGRRAQLCVDVQTAGAAGHDLRVRYSVTGSNFADFPGAAADREVSIDATGWSASEWFEIPQAAKSERCRLELRGKDGNGATSPVVDRVLLRVI